MKRHSVRKGSNDDGIGSSLLQVRRTSVTGRRLSNSDIAQLKRASSPTPMGAAGKRDSMWVEQFVNEHVDICLLFWYIIMVWICQGRLSLWLDTVVFHKPVAITINSFYFLSLSLFLLYFYLFISFLFFLSFLFIFYFHSGHF